MCPGLRNRVIAIVDEQQPSPPVRPVRVPPRSATSSIAALAGDAGEMSRHGWRVAHYAKVIASEMSRSAEFASQITPHDVELIFHAAKLHDVGKSMVPAAIRSKPARLTSTEREFMQRHAEDGARILEDAMRLYPETPFLPMARDVAISHHERWDGEGYPRGLSGAAIPLAARIVAVADVYDAITSDRPYRSAGDHVQAASQIVAGNGTQFDPSVVSAFMATQSRIARLLAQTADRVVEADETLAEAA
jgi:putative two-component system response regulator